MKQIIIKCIILNLFIFIGCTSENTIFNFSEEQMTLSQEEPIVYTIDTSLKTVDLARKIAIDYSCQTMNSRAQRTNYRVVKEMQTIEDNEGNPAMYVFNYQDNKGFIITSATQDYMPILAFSDKGNFDVNKTKGTSIETWIHEEKKNIATVRQASDSIKAKFQIQWIPYTITPIPLSQLVTTKGSYSEVQDFIIKESATWVAQGYQPIALGVFKGQHHTYYVDTSVMDLIIRECESYGTTEFGGLDNTCFILVKESNNTVMKNSLGTPEWNQGFGYNTYIPNGYPVGCVPVAVGEIMKYWKYPTSFNWSQITSGASDGTAQFLYQVALACNTDFGQDGSGATAQNALNAFHNYGYTQASLVKHNKKTVMSNINSGKPVCMFGRTPDNSTGHAWVCDGYKYMQPRYEIVLKALSSKTSFYTQNFGICSQNILNVYYYVNWGYGGWSNGFYYSANMNVDGKDYNSSRSDIVNIYH